MSIDIIIGDCPAFEEESSDEPFRECVGERDEPYFASQANNETAGFRLQSLVQFFFIMQDNLGTGMRKHSCIEMWWDANGMLESVWIDNYKGDIVPDRLWGRDGRTGTSFLRQRHETDMFDEDGCPIFPPAESSSDASSGMLEHDTVGVIVRVQALEGSYGLTSESYAPSSLTTPAACGKVLKVYYEGNTFDCGEYAISDVEPTLGDNASELAMEFDSNGLLKRVYWGGGAPCADNPCVWDRDDAPPNTAGVVVPVLQFVADDYDDNFRVYQIHFDSTGRYIKTCQYALLCGCTLDSSTSSSGIACPCVSQACVYLPDCIETIQYLPPASVFFLCADALAPGGEQCPSSLQENYVCEYLHTEQSCPEDVSISTEASGSVIGSNPPSGRTGCLYLLGPPSCNAA